MKHSTTIGIVGTGNLAQVLAKLFKREKSFRILHASRSKPVNHLEIFPLQSVLACDVVICAIPISALEEFLKTHGQEIAKGSLFMDVCSVKIKPALWMQQHISKEVDILATHPLFGPISTNNGTDFKNLRIVVSPIRISQRKKLKKFLDFLRKHHIKIIRMRPEKHDHIMSKTQAISFLFGTLGLDIGLQKTALDTHGFSCILENQSIVATDTHQLFADILQYNPYVANTMAKIKRAMSKYT